MSHTYEPRNHPIECPKCGSRFYVSTRAARHIQDGSYSGLCEECRRISANIHVTDAMRNYWLGKYTMQEIKELAAGLDMLLNDHSRFAYDPPAKDKNWAA